MVDLSPAAFAVRVDGEWVPPIRFANLLLRSGHRVSIITGALPSAENGAGLPPGSFVVSLSPAVDPGLERPPSVDEVRAAAADAGIALTPVDEGERLIAAPLAPVRVGLYGGGGAPFNHAAILAECGFPVRFLSDAEVRAGELAEVDVFVVPGGGSRAMLGQLEPLGEDGCRAIADFVRRGGMYVGCCAGAYDCIVNTEAFVRSCPAQRCLQLINAGPWHCEGVVEFLDLQSPGVGVVTVRNERPDHPVMLGMPPSFEIVHYNGPVLDPLPTRVVDGASAAVGLAAFAGWTPQFTPAEAFAGPPAADRPTYLTQAIAAGRFAAMAGELGTGRVVAFGSHPELGFDLPMAEWTVAARMLANAVLWQGMSRRGAGGPARPAGETAGRISLPVGTALAEVPALAHAVAEHARALQRRPIDPAPRWLAPEYALSVFGMPPAAIWRQALADIQTLAAGAATLAARLRERILAIVAGANGELAAPGRAAVLQVERWLLDERPPEWEQDGGYQGVLSLLRQAIRKCEAAGEQWQTALGPPAGPYAYLDANPYHLVAGSYLAAIGCVAGAVQLLRALAAEVELAERLTAENAPLAAIAWSAAGRSVHSGGNN